MAGACVMAVVPHSAGQLSWEVAMLLLLCRDLLSQSSIADPVTRHDVLRSGLHFLAAASF